MSSVSGDKISGEWEESKRNDKFNKFARSVRTSELSPIKFEKDANHLSRVRHTMEILKAATAPYPRFKYDSNIKLHSDDLL